MPAAGLESAPAAVHPQPWRGTPPAQTPQLPWPRHACKRLRLQREGLRRPASLLLASFPPSCREEIHWPASVAATKGQPGELIVSGALAPTVLCLQRAARRADCQRRRSHGGHSMPAGRSSSSLRRRHAERNDALIVVLIAHNSSPALHGQACTRTCIEFVCVRFVRVVKVFSCASATKAPRTLQAITNRLMASLLQQAQRDALPLPG